MPAFVNIRVGSPLSTIGADGTMVQPFEAKNFRKLSRISFAVIISILNVNNYIFD